MPLSSSALTRSYWNFWPACLLSYQAGDRRNNICVCREKMGGCLLFNIFYWYVKWRRWLDLASISVFPPYCATLYVSFFSSYSSWLDSMVPFPLYLCINKYRIKLCLFLNWKLHLCCDFWRFSLPHWRNKLFKHSKESQNFCHHHGLKGNNGRCENFILIWIVKLVN